MSVDICVPVISDSIKAVSRIMLLKTEHKIDLLHLSHEDGFYAVKVVLKVFFKTGPTLGEITLLADRGLGWGEKCLRWLSLFITFLTLSKTCQALELNLQFNWQQFGVTCDCPQNFMFPRQAAIFRQAFFPRSSCYATESRTLFARFRWITRHLVVSLPQDLY